MTFLWPKFLVLLGVIPILMAIYAWLLRRRRSYAVRYASLALVRGAVPRRWGWMRHLPFGLFLLALGSLMMALGRPYTVGEIPSDQTVVILALDVSRSMCSTDIQPTRLAAAEQASLGYIERQKPTTQVGVVAFSGFAEVVQPPTMDPERLQTAVESLMLGTTTAIGSGILRSLDAIASVDPNVSPSQEILPGSGQSDGGASEPTPEATPQAGEGLTSPDRPFQPDIIILLTDGVSNTGPQPLDAARQAAERGVRVYTIGYGTAGGIAYPYCPADLVGNDPTTGFVSVQINSSHNNHGVGGLFQDQEQAFRPLDANAGGGSYPRGIDEETLKKVSDLTGGKYYPVDSASELHQVFQQLATLRITHRAVREVSVAFAAAGAMLAALAIGLSLFWRPV